MPDDIPLRDHFDRVMADHDRLDDERFKTLSEGQDRLLARYEEGHKDLTARIDAEAEERARAEGRSTGMGATWHGIIAAVGVIVGVTSLIIAFAVR